MAFTEEQKKEIQGLLVESLKGDALKEVFGGLIDPLKAELTRQISGVSAKLSKSLKETEDRVSGLTSEEGRAAFVKELAALGGGNQQDQNKGGTPAGGDKGESKPDPAFLKLQADFEKLNKERAAEREQAKAEKEAAQRSLDQAAIEKVLGGHVANNPDVITAARMLLTDARKMIVRNDEGQLVFNMPRKSGKETYTEAMSLEDGIAEWAKTDSAKYFLPPKEAGGSNDREGGKGGRGPAVGSFEANRAAFFADPALR